MPELPLSNGFVNILVVVDKLTKYATLIPTTSSINEEQTAESFFKNIVTRFGLPKQIITDCDSRWTGTVGCIYASNPQLKSNILQSYFISFKFIAKTSKQLGNIFSIFFWIFTDICSGTILISTCYLLYEGFCICFHLKV